MTLNSSQLEELIENYATHVIEGLDNDSMQSMLFDLLTREYETYTEAQLVGEIQELYGDELTAELIEVFDDNLTGKILNLREVIYLTEL